MSLFATKVQNKATQDDENLNTDLKLRTETRAKVFNGAEPALKHWKISAPEVFPSQDSEDVTSSGDTDDENVKEFSGNNGGMLPPGGGLSTKGYSPRLINSARSKTPFWLQASQAIAVFLTVSWITYVGLYVFSLPGGIKSVTSSPLALGLVFACVMTPVAMLWLCLSAWQRRSDAHVYAHALRQELRDMLYPGEEQSRLIGEDLQLLMRQATEMSAMSRATVKAVQRARSGLRNEIKDFSGITQKAETHIDRLSETLTKRSEELLSLTEVIEAQTEVISHKSSMGIKAWENASSEISELGDEIDTLFTNGSKKITQASEDASRNIDGIEEKMTGAAEKFSEKMGDIADQITKTQERIDADTMRLGKMTEVILSGADRLELTLQGAEKISGAVENVMQVMSGSLDKVETTSKELFERTDQIEEKLQERANNLKQSAEDLLNSTSALEKVGDVATHKLGEALATAVDGAENISNAVRRSKDMLDKSVSEATGHIESSSRLAEERMEKIMISARSNQESMNELLGAMDVNNQDLDRATTRLDLQKDKTVDAVSLATSALEKSVNMMVKQTSEPVTLITQAVERLSNKSSEIDDVLSRRVVELEQSNAKMRQSVEEISDKMQGSLESTTSVADLLEAQSNRVNENIDQYKTDITSLANELDLRTQEIMALLDSQSRGLDVAVRTSQDQISALGDTLIEKSDSVISRTSGITSELASMGTSIADILDELERKTDFAGNLVKSNVDKMSLLATQSEPDCHRMVAAAEALEEKYARLRDSYMASTEEVFDHLNAAGQKIDDRLENLMSGVETSANTMFSVSDQLGNSILDIRSAAEKAQEGILMVQHGVDDKINDLGGMTEIVQTKIASLNENLGGYMDELAIMVERATGELEEATNLFGQSTNILDHKVDNATRKIAEGAKYYLEEGQRISLLAEQTTHKSSRIIAAVRDESATLIESVHASLSELQKSGETLSMRTREIETYMNASISKTENLGKELKQQAGYIASASVEVVDNISNATASLSLKADEVREAGQVVIEDMEFSRQKLADESTRMSTFTRRAIEAADEAATVFSRNSQNLYRSVQEIADQAKKLKETQLRSERESFLNSSKYIVESLYSLAVDVSRHMEDEINERVLKAYQRGDVAAFATHLIETSNRIPLDRSQQKFIDDVDFRTYTLRFIRQYEEVTEQAHENDYGELLTSLFNSSDIGKLYKILCEIAGRNAKTH